MVTDPRSFKHTLLSFEEERIKLIVGEEKKEFYVARQPLEHGSEYFRLALTKDWQEGESKTVILEDADPDIVHRYLQFVYTGKIASREGRDEQVVDGVERIEPTDKSDSDSDSEDSSDENSDGESLGSEDTERDEEDLLIVSGNQAGNGSSDADDSHTSADREYTLLAQLYCFGERMQDHRFQNAVVDAIIANVRDTHRGKLNGRKASFKHYPSIQVVNLIYEGTPSGSPARRLMVNIYGSHCEPGWLEDNVNTEFSLSLARKLCELRKSQLVARKVSRYQRDKLHNIEFYKGGQGGPSRVRKRKSVEMQDADWDVLQREAEGRRRDRGNWVEAQPPGGLT
ncbi:hypothetical protein LTR10_003477 [Elasticomyces elasticus]|nr:hypothetical protein LTR10_003477 [Elasticomyces elasticus]KAK4969745.1 hypothetical protein LTR42_009017 [Elasticomyces elasticus]